MRAYLIGHTKEKPGAVRDCDGITERQLLERMRDYLQVHQTKNWCVIDEPHGEAIDGYSGIYSRIKQATAKKIEWAIELHINNVPPSKADNYALILYNQKIENVAKGLRDYTGDFLKDNGIERWVLAPIPDPKWPNFAAITKAPYPAMIFEPFFINNKKHTVAEHLMFEFCPLLADFINNFKGDKQ